MHKILWQCCRTPWSVAIASGDIARPPGALPTPFVHCQRTHLGNARRGSGNAQNTLAMLQDPLPEHLVTLPAPLEHCQSPLCIAREHTWAVQEEALAMHKILWQCSRTPWSVARASCDIARPPGALPKPFVHCQRTHLGSAGRGSDNAQNILAMLQDPLECCQSIW